MPEDLKVDCHECKDLAFARNLAAQMKEGYGRHNSNLSFRPGPPSGRGNHFSEFRYAATPMRDAIIPIIHVRENEQARVIGRIGDNALRERWQDCAIGDAVPEAKMEHGYELHSLTGTEIISKCLPILEPLRPELWFRGATIPDPAKTNPYEKRTFERVRITVTDDGGDHWHEEYLWKRIE